MPSQQDNASFPRRPSKPGKKIRVLAFDGAKVHDFLFHVALAEIQWRNLENGSSSQLSALVQNHQARNRASVLYRAFLQACGTGPRYATAFLTQQHQLCQMYLRRSQAILQASELQEAKNQMVLSEIAFGAQTIKSAATVGMAVGAVVAGLVLVGPEATVAAGIGLAFDFSMGLINKLGEPSPDAVVVGFKQTMANDAVGVAGSVQQVSFDSAKQAMEQTLSYPMKSSVYRATAGTASQLSDLMTTLGIISAGVTLYTEGEATWGSFEQMSKAQNDYASMQSQSR